MFLHQNDLKYTWTYPDGKIHNQIGYILVGGRWYLSVLNVRSFRGAHYLVAAKIMVRLAVSKQAAQKFDVERFNLMKLNELEVRKQYHIKISNGFAALKNLSDCEDMYRA